VLGSLLFTATPADAKFGDASLSKGDRGRDVRVLQRWLGYLGFETSVDGHFGRETSRALRAYERRFDMRVDGRLSTGQARGLRKRATAAYASRDRNAATPRALTEGTGETATLGDDGRAVAPASAPQPVKDAIAAANQIVDKPYRYGGGHGSFEDSGYDCSGAVSYALHGAGVLDAPLDSSGLMSFGDAGEGQWITVYAHGGHAYVVIAGLRFDTSGSGEKGPRWRPEKRSPSGYTVRHPAGL
jgi:cell wall-associated NlpC family hydrolase